MKKLNGTVVKKSGDKTVAVEVKRTIVHPLYQKRQVRTKIYLVHDPKNEAEVGKEVEISESRPISKRKRWQISYGA